MDQITKVNENNYELPSEVIPDPGANIVLGGPHDYDSVTERIAGVVYLPMKQVAEEVARRRVHSLSVLSTC